MGTYHWMLGAWVGLVPKILPAITPNVVLVTVMDASQPCKESLHLVRECLVGRIHTGKERVPPGGRDLLDTKHARHGWLDVTRNIGMPHFTGDEFHGGIPVHDKNLGMLRVLGSYRMHVQIAEAITKRFLLLEGKRLVSKKQHEMLQPCGLQCSEHLGCQCFGQIETRHFGTDDWGEGIYLQRP